MIDPAIATVLDRLHQAARGDWKRGLGVVPHFVWSKLTGKSFMKMVSPAKLKDMYIPVSRDGGRLLYMLARSIGARRVVEFGASFGISTLYLGAAVRDGGGGQVITTEIEPSKCRALESNVREAGLAEIVRVLEGDALQTLAQVEGPIDLVFLDGWKDLYLPVLELLTVRLRPGALVVADNTNFPDVRPYLTRVRQGAGFTSAPLVDGRMECSCYTPLQSPGRFDPEL
jgi:predicted O-methyltransferase YrrM